MGNVATQAIVVRQTDAIVVRETQQGREALERASSATMQLLFEVQHGYKTWSEGILQAVSIGYRLSQESK
jgi:hypothetical protein